MKLKYTKRPKLTAQQYAQHVTKMFPADYAGMSIFAMMGKWCAVRNAVPLQRLQKRKRRLKEKMNHILGLAIASILSVAHKHGVIITFNAMDAYIETTGRQPTSLDWALGIFHSYASKWCTSVTSYEEPDDGVVQLMLQGMLNSVGLMCFWSKCDPVVDCFLPVYNNLIKINERKN